MNLNKILLIAFGFFLTIEQGFTVVLGVLSNGMARGADVLMPVDVAIYALFLIKPARRTPRKSTGLVNIALIFGFLFWGWSLTGEMVAIEKADFRFGMVHLTRAILVFWCIIARVTSKQDVIDFSQGVVLGLGLQAFISVWQWQIGPVYLPFFTI